MIAGRVIGRMEAWELDAAVQEVHGLGPKRKPTEDSALCVSLLEGLPLTVELRKLSQSTYSRDLTRDYGRQEELKPSERTLPEREECTQGSRVRGWRVKVGRGNGCLAYGRSFTLAACRALVRFEVNRRRKAKP